MSNTTLGLMPELVTYLMDIGVHESAELEALRRYTTDMPEANMQIAPEQGRFMQLMVHLIGANKYIEVGTFTGYSALAIAQAMGPSGLITCCDISKQWTDIALKHWQGAKVEQKINLILGPAKDSLDSLINDDESGSYDLAFIDADKGNYAVYYDQCLTLLRPGGCLLIDNVFWGGKVTNASTTDFETRAIQELNEKIRTDERVFQGIIPIADGLQMVIKK